MLVGRRVVGVGAMALAVVEHEIDRLALGVDLDAAALRDGDVELARLSGVRHEDVRPAGGGDLAHIDGEVLESVVEDARLELALRSTREHAHRKLPEPLVRPRNRDLDDVERGSRCQ